MKHGNEIKQSACKYYLLITYQFTTLFVVFFSVYVNVALLSE